MGAETEIAWTNHTFNPWWGCVRVSPGCTNCYAEAWDKHRGGETGPHWGARAPRRFFTDKHWNEPLKWDRAAAAAGRRARVFCASMADVFEDRRDLDSQRDRLWSLIGATPHLDWQLLTKRPENLSKMLPWMPCPTGLVCNAGKLDKVVCAEDECDNDNGVRGKPWPNVWIGTTVEDQERADERIPHLLRTPAAVRFLSCEPLLGPVDLSRWIERVDHCHSCGAEHPPQTEDRCPKCGDTNVLNATWGEDEAQRWRDGDREADIARDVAGNGGPQIHWTIVGGESGPGARNFWLPWARSIVAQCKAAGVKTFVKQLGSKPLEQDDPTMPPDHPHISLHGIRLNSKKGGDPGEWPEDLRIREFPNSQGAQK